MDTNGTTPGSPAEQHKLARFLSDSLMRHLKVASDWAVSILYEGVRERGHGGIRRTHELVIVPMKLEGTRLTDIARASHVTKNAVGQLASELEMLGYVRRGEHPDDGRAKLLHFTNRGHQLLADAMAANEELEAAVAAMIGEEKSRQLCLILEELAQKITAIQAVGTAQIPG